ncbi:MAG: TonB C-terminal domain-containing protein [Verrucomicrobiales bacterium]|nr:TonB C-terminal domain-containing protein [Verrucomicrobiales bacterium]MCP5556700.1 TonB C-terminal domain-containing protein [Verrucomicrobiaceae bacterium]
MPARHSLEPIRASTWLVVLVHGLLAGGLWYWYQTNAIGSESDNENLLWLAPGDFSTSTLLFSKSASTPASTILNQPLATPAPASPVAATQSPATNPAATNPAVTVNRHIMLRRETSTTTSGGNTSGRLDMSEVDNAIYEAFYKNWVPSSAALSLPRQQRTAVLRVIVSRAGDIESFDLVSPSGSQDLDDSVLAAGKLVKKIPQSLPSSFPKARYECSLKFFVE